MKKTKFLALILCLSFLCTLLLPATAYADDPPAGSGMKFSKTATANKDGSYTIMLEAFATGSQTTSTQTKDVPTDIILVLDQSGSMADAIGQVRYTEYSGKNTQNNRNYEKRHNGGSANLWHKLDDGSYVSVSVTKTTLYKALSTDLPNFDHRNDCYWDYKNNLYEKVGDEYKNVAVDYYWNIRKSTYTYTYTFSSDNSTIQSDGNDSVPVFGNRGPLYTPDTVYTYTYTDSTGATQTMGTSTGANTRFKPAFYQRSVNPSGGGSRLDALKNAANAFANAVEAKAEGNSAEGIKPINHRIAVVGYADTDWDYGYNTGVFIGSALNRYEKTAAAGVYGTALQDMSTTGGKNNVAASLNALTASGATRTDYGLIMAKGILDANPVPQNETRNRVVIVFTDGSPTDYNGFQTNVANSAITAANAIKAGGTTVYSIGIFSGADASSAGTKPSNDLSNSSNQLTAACNWFMQQVSSNNGTPRYPSYYLSAGDAASLNSIFQQISNNITTGGSSTTLGSETVVKDIISPYFTLPDGTTASDIQIKTYACTGKNGNTYTWSSTSGGSGGASAKVNGDQVSVTGFNFSENWCGTETDAQGTTFRGKKLVISFKVEPKDDFLGGNDVPTNASAGIYENASAQNPVITFERPTVNVPIDAVTVTAADKNVYLLGEVTADQLKTGATVKVGDVTLDLSKANDAEQPYGLDPWQTEFVNITATVKDKATGNEVTDFKDLVDDKEYTIEVTVTPKTEGTTTPEKGEAATAKTGVNNPAGKINVFKPEVTFKDSQITLGETANYADNKPVTNFEVWKHDTATAPAEMGTAPELTYTYAPTADAFQQDTPVEVSTVKINGTDVTRHVTFKHQPCGVTGCKWETVKDNAHFIVHVKSLSLKITKQGASDLDKNQSFVFVVSNDRNDALKIENLEVVIHGNESVTLNGLPVGTYTVTEKANWSWRYTPDATSKNAKLTATGTTIPEVTFNNDRDKIYWLTGGTWCDNRWIDSSKNVPTPASN